MITVRYICMYIYIFIYLTHTHTYIVILVVIRTYHAVYWSYQASRTDRWCLPRSIPWVMGLPEVADSMTEDPEHRGYWPARHWGQWCSGNCRALALAMARSAGPLIRGG